MRCSVLLAAASGSALLLSPPRVEASVTPAADVHVTVYRNGLVWTGRGFMRRTIYVGGSKILSGVPAGATAADVDLKGGFVVPPLGSAHEHKINPDPESDWSFFSDGVFYVWNANSIVESPKRRAYYNRPGTIDYETAMGGISEPGGHPEVLYTEVLTKWVYKGENPSDFLNDAFHYGRTHKEIDDALDELGVQGADFVKAFLLVSENYGARKRDPRTHGARGLSPANYAYLVAAAHRRGLRVMTHLESAADLRAVARAGGDIAGHLPAFDGTDVTDDLSRLRVDPTLARLVARAHVLAVPTYSVARNAYHAAPRNDAERRVRTRILAIQGYNLRNLVRAGATLLTGTDQGTSVVDELKQWTKVGGMPRLAALRFGFGTGRHMFPERHLGCFDPGCRADFLVLRENPVRNLEALRTILRMVKEGVELHRRPKPIEQG